MLNLIKQKKSVSPLLENIIFLVITVLFFGALFVWVARVGSEATFHEQRFSKQIALLIDSAKPGTTIELDVSELTKLAEKNKYKGGRITIDKTKNEVIVRVTEGGGYSFQYFNSANIELKKSDDKNKLIIGVE